MPARGRAALIKCRDALRENVLAEKAEGDEKLRSGVPLGASRGVWPASVEESELRRLAVTVRRAAASHLVKFVERFVNSIGFDVCTTLELLDVAPS